MNLELAVRNGGLFWGWKGFDRVFFFLASAVDEN